LWTEGAFSQAELDDGIAPIGEQALPEGGVGPSLRDHARSVLGDPLFLGEMLELVDELGGLHAPRLERFLDGVDALFDGSGGMTDMRLVGISAAPAGFSRYRKPLPFRHLLPPGRVARQAARNRSSVR